MAQNVSSTKIKYMSIRFPAELLDKIRKAAAKDGRSFNSFIVVAAARACDVVMNGSDKR